MEVAAPSCPPERLPACECLALSHEWALCGEAVCLPSLPLSTVDASATTYVCVARATSCFPIRISSIETRGSGVCLARVQIPRHIAD